MPLEELDVKSMPSTVVEDSLTESRHCPGPAIMAKRSSVGGIEVLLRDPAQPESLDPYYSGCEKHTELLKAGWRKSPERAAFATDTIWEANIQVPMRDGVRLRVDVFRPADSDSVKVPALIAWSPYGKSGQGRF